VDHVGGAPVFGSAPRCVLSRARWRIGYGVLTKYGCTLAAYIKLGPAGSVDCGPRFCIYNNRVRINYEGQLS